MAAFDGGEPDRALQDFGPVPGALIEALQPRDATGPNDSFPVDRLAEFAAAVDSANYYSHHMTQARSYGSKFDLLTNALQVRGGEGLIAEFGVFEGTTINFLADQTRETIFGFDCFDGLPEDWRPGFPKGMFSRGIPTVRPNVSLVVGLFEKTLPSFLEQHPQEVSFLHIDCDLYSSTRTVLRLCAPRIRKGTVLAFDEYFNYPGWRNHEFKAFQEFIAETGHAYEYLSVVPSHQQVAVIITR